MTDTSAAGGAERYWDEFHREHGAAWSGRPNPLLVREVKTLAPGSALDLGCGQGADAIWLAHQGWTVTAVDVAPSALARAAEHAAAAGAGDRITWEHHDLPRSFPAGSFDLVSVQFFHSPVALDGEREAALVLAALAVAPSGVLLVVDHAGWPSWVEEPPFDYRFPTGREVLDGLRLEPGRWDVELEQLAERGLAAPDGRPGVRQDRVVRLKRH